jgi:hypothetical protein
MGNGPELNAVTYQERLYVVGRWDRAISQSWPGEFFVVIGVAKPTYAGTE